MARSGLADLGRLEIKARSGLVAAGAIFLVLSALYTVPVFSDDEWAEFPSSWPNQGGSLSNRRDRPYETKISNESVSSLALRWTAQTKWNVGSTPSIDARLGAVYFSSYDGFQYAVKEDTGALIWKVNLTEIAPSIPGLVQGIFVAPYIRSLYGNPALTWASLLCRSTPTIAGPLLIFGVFGPCYVLALNRTTGGVVWWQSLDSHKWCVITMSGTYHDGYYYIGTSSEEESSLLEECCTFIGKFFKLDAKTGKILWSVPMLPDNHNKTGLYAGSAVWGSSPAIDEDRRLVYIATGNDYTTPPAVSNCENARLNETVPPVPDPCVSPEDHSESILAIDIDSGTICWATKLGAYDTWLLVCLISPVPLPNCPKVLGPDADFGEAPILVTINKGDKEKQRDIVVCGQKNGIIHALDRDTGGIVWQTDAGPGGEGGGASWGMTTDGERVFTNIVNSNSKNFTLVPSSTVITWGGWVAMNASTGAVIWSTANPDIQQNAQSPVAHANGVVFGASAGKTTGESPLGLIVAMDAKTGKVLWDYRTQGIVAGGVSISDGCIFQPVGGTISSVGTDPNISTLGHSTISLCVP